MDSEWFVWVAGAALLAAIVVLLIRVGRRRRIGETVANVVVPLGLVALMVVGVYQLQEAPDSRDCVPRDTAKAVEKATTKEQSLRKAVRVAQAKALRARQRADAEPSAAARRNVRETRRQVARAKDRVQAWTSATLAVEEDAVTSFKFGHDVNSGHRSISFTADRPVLGPRLLDVEVKGLAPTGSGRELGAREVKAWAVVDPDRRHGTVYLCLVPGERLSAPSGEFTGTLVVGSGRVERLDVPVTVTLAYARTTLVMLVGLAVALASSVYVYFLRRPELPELMVLGLVTDSNPRKDAEEKAQRALRSSFGFWHGYWRWVSSASGAITVVAGLAGATTAFSAQYLASETWASGFKDWFAFIGAVATAFVAAGTAGKLASLEYDKPYKDASKSQ